MKVDMVIYRLTCGHLILGAANSRMVPCVYCEWFKRAPTGIVIKEWHATCPNCSFGRWCGLSESLANQIADKHNRAHKGHKATHKADINQKSVKIRDRMQKHGYFTEGDDEE